MTFVDSNPVVASNPRTSDKGTIGQSKEETGSAFDAVFKSLDKPDLLKAKDDKTGEKISSTKNLLPSTDVTHISDVADEKVLLEKQPLKPTQKPEPTFEQDVRVEENDSQTTTEPSQPSFSKIDSKNPVNDMLEMLQTTPSLPPAQAVVTDVVSINNGLLQPQPMPLVSDTLQKVEAVVRTDNADRKSAVSSLSSIAGTTERPDADEPMPTEDDKTFRFARADGKGASVNVAISALAEGARKDTTAASADKVEAVTVLDSRRYLGLPATNNVALISSALAKETALVQTGQSSLVVIDDQTSKVVNTLKLQLTPIELGSVVATLRLSGEALNVDLRVETGAAYRQLSDDQSAIIKTLQAQGFEIDQINVRLVSSDVAAVQTDNQAGQQPKQGQQGSFAQSQQQQNNPQSSSRDDRRAREESKIDQAPGQSSDNGVRGGVYL